jgi:hypothetical protein
MGEPTTHMDYSQIHATMTTNMDITMDISMDISMDMDMAMRLEVNMEIQGIRKAPNVEEHKVLAKDQAKLERLIVRMRTFPALKISARTKTAIYQFKPFTATRTRMSINILERKITNLYVFPFSDTSTAKTAPTNTPMLSRQLKLMLIKKNNLNKVNKCVKLSTNITVIAISALRNR